MSSRGWLYYIMNWFDKLLWQWDTEVGVVLKLTVDIFESVFLVVHMFMLVTLEKGDQVTDKGGSLWSGEWGEAEID